MKLCSLGGFDCASSDLQLLILTYVVYKLLKLLGNFKLATDYIFTYKPSLNLLNLPSHCPFIGEFEFLNAETSTCSELFADLLVNAT